MSSKGTDWVLAAMNGAVLVVTLFVAVALPWKMQVPAIQIAAMWMSAVASVLLILRVGAGKWGYLTFICGLLGGMAIVEFTVGRSGTWPMPWMASFIVALFALGLLKKRITAQRTKQTP